MFRLFFGIFMGGYRGTGRTSHAHAEDEDEEEPSQQHAGERFMIHEAPAVMTIPLIILAVLSVVGGWVGSFSIIGLSKWHPLANFLAPVFSDVTTLHEASFAVQWVSTGVSVLLAVAGIVWAWRLYGRGFQYKESQNPLYQLVLHKYYVDEILTAVIVQPVLWFGRTATRYFEGGFLDGGSRAIAGALRGTSAGLRRLQTGYMRNYALAILIGVVLIIVYYAVRG
jgi:NADH-quinone oxidoreductase subunit L